MNLVPFEMSPFLIHYFFQEFDGVEASYGKYKVKTIPIKHNSHIGKYIISNLKKIDYPIKDITQFNVFIELKKVNRKYLCKKHRVFKVEDLSTSFLELPKEYIKETNKMLGEIFYQNFFYYVLGASNNKESKVNQCIRDFIDQYSLWDYMDIKQMSKVYYRMKGNTGKRLQGITIYRN